MSKLRRSLRLGRAMVWRARTVVLVVLCVLLLLLVHSQNLRPLDINYTALLGLSQHRTKLPSNSASPGFNLDHNKPPSKSPAVVDWSTPVSLLTTSAKTSVGWWVQSRVTQEKKDREPGVVYTHDIYVNGFQYAHPELCPYLGKYLRLVILVTSNPSHAAARNKIRQTWGHNMTRYHVSIAFVLGEPPRNLKPSIKAENSLHGDIIMGRYIDTYSNLTLKTLSILEWMDTYCPHAPYLLKTDDDMLINVERLMNFTTALEYINASRTIWGRVWSNVKPNRSTKSRYYVTAVQFPDEVFPDYASGSGYVMTADCVSPLLASVSGERYVRLEDVFVTGVLAARCGVQRVNVSSTFTEMIIM